MPRFSTLLNVLPMLLLAVSVAGAAALTSLLSQPEIAVRAALAPTSPDAGGQTWTDDPALLRRSPTLAEAFDKTVDGTAGGSIADVAISQDDARGGFEPLGQTSGLGIGDRLTIARGAGQMRTFEVVKIRRLGALLDKVADRSHGGDWMLVVAQDVSSASAPELRFLVQDGVGLPFGISRESARSL